MATLFKILVLIEMFFIIASLSDANKGTATFYTKLRPSACYGFKKEGSMIAAASDEIWNGGSVCGTEVTIRCIGATNGLPHPCTGASVVVKIADYCPDCNGTIDLSEAAFSKIANTDAGKIRIEFDM